jgi:4-amino-4-deoxy-L-arabinose transferase-like glycosyltransferase
MTSAQKKIQVLAALSLMEGITASLWLMSMPSNRQMYSVSRLVALFGIFLIVLMSAAVLLNFRKPREEFSAFAEKMITFKYRIVLSCLLMVAGTIIWVAVLFKSQWLFFINETTYLRLLPIVLYMVLLLFQAGLFLLLLTYERNRNNDGFHIILRLAFLAWVFFLLLWLFISVTRLGFIHDDVGLSWGPPGTPITFAQVNLVLAIGFLLWLGWLAIRSSQHKVLLFLFSKMDWIIFIGLWLLAVLLWYNTTMSPTHFAPAPLLPNEEVYPNSDALIFDRASYHLLHGIGFDNQLIRRPLYVGMLALFHAVAGGNYEKTIFLQILVLALIPPLVYLLTFELSSRLGGLIAGGLILLREKNSIELSGLIVTSHAKLLMSDMMAMLGVILVLYLTVRLLNRKNYSNWAPAIAGVCLGLTTLIRAQVLILLPVLLLFLIISKKPMLTGFKISGLFLLGIVLAMLPWVWRNWNLTGTFVLDDRGEEKLLARNYSMTPFSMPARLEGETEREFSARLKADVITFIRTHPKDILFFVSNHFFRNLAVSAVYIAPAYPTDTPSMLVKNLPFWDDWAGYLHASGLPLFINLTILAFGVGIAVANNKFAGLLPLAAFLVYGFGDALVRSSGWRFILPADWVILVYYSIALAYLPSEIKYVFPAPIPVQADRPAIFLWKTSFSGAFIFFTLLLLGASVPAAEQLIHKSSYDGFLKNVKTDLSAQSNISPQEINTFLEQKGAVLLSGIALYPRYIRPGVNIHLADAPSGYKYLHFWLMNETDNQIVLPLEASPGGIPHTAIVSVLGCKEEAYISAYAVIVLQPAKQILIRDPRVFLRCPLRAPK